MATNARYHKDRLESVRNLVTVRVAVPIGASGAPGTHIGRGVVVTRTGAGAYTATIRDFTGTISAILAAQVTVVSTARGNAYVHTPLSGSGNTVTFTTAVASAPDTAADPANGSRLLVEITYRNSPSNLL